METMVKLAIERMNEEIERLKTLVKEQQLRILTLEKRGSQPSVQPPEPTVAKPDELLTNHQVKGMLRIGKNTLLKLVAQGMITAIRLNPRTIRYSYAELRQYIERKQALSQR
jgi:hypothetical protein